MAVCWGMGIFPLSLSIFSNWSFFRLTFSLLREHGSCKVCIKERYSEMFFSCCLDTPRWYRWWSMSSAQSCTRFPPSCIMMWYIIINCTGMYLGSLVCLDSSGLALTEFTSACTPIGATSTLGRVKNPPGYKTWTQLMWTNTLKSDICIELLGIIIRGPFQWRHIFATDHMSIDECLTFL